MEQIIITVYDRRSGGKQDIEVLTNVPADQLLDDIMQALSGYKLSLYWNLSQIVLYSHRLTENWLKGERCWTPVYGMMIFCILQRSKQIWF